MTTADLDAPFTLRSGATLAHRVALAPLTNTQSHADGTLGDDEARWLLARAHHFALTSTCAAFVAEEGHAWEGQLGIARDAHLSGLTRLAEGLRAAGTVGVVQLHHAGAKATLAPVKLSTVAGPGVRAAAEDDIAKVISDFVAAALRAAKAGFAGVEIHGANGYLFTQFLAPLDNPRTDAYGGDLGGRARLLRQTVQAVRASVPKGFAVGVRLSPVDLWAQRGLVLADTARLVGWLADDGVDWVHLSLANAAGPPPHEPGAGPVVRAIRAALPAEVGLWAAGGVWTADDARVVRDLGADVVVVGKAAIAHADWPRAARAPRFEPQRPPWSLDHLHEQLVGPAFVRYLGGMRGMVRDEPPPA
jgi:2,4-dienoyl-CoA reductase-like NADH-dependent reductase (Old Yellow Enzyme family)